MHGADERLFSGTENPRAANDERVAARGGDGALAGEFRPAVCVDRFRFVVNAVQFLLHAFEYVVAAEVHDRRRHLGQIPRAVDVDGLRELRIVLTRVDADDRAVDDQIRTEIGHLATDSVAIGDVEIGVRERDRAILRG